MINNDPFGLDSRHGIVAAYIRTKRGDRHKVFRFFEVRTTATRLKHSAKGREREQTTDSRILKVTATNDDSLSFSVITIITITTVALKMAIIIIQVGRVTTTGNKNKYYCNTKHTASGDHLQQPVLYINRILIISLRSR